MKVDLHVHSRLSKNFDFNHEVIGRLRELGIRRGLDALALTEHIHAKNFWEMGEFLRSKHRYKDDHFDIDGFPMFSGCEVTVGERVDFIVVGDYDRLQKLDAAFYPRLSEDNHPPGLEFLSRARELDLLVISAHPYRPGKETAKLPLDEVFSLVDGVEANGRDHGTERLVASLAHKYGLAVSGGSDAHYYLQVGIRSTVLADGDVSLAGLRGAFARRETRAHCKPYAAQVVRLCEEIKNIAKRRKEQEAAAVVAA